VEREVTVKKEKDGVNKSGCVSEQHRNSVSRLPPARSTVSLKPLSE
jgi:hypothetical protein